MKNYKGKLKGLKRLSLVKQKRNEEAELQKFIDADAERKVIYGNLLDEIGEIYTEIRKTAERDRILGYSTRSSTPLSTAYTLYEASIELKKKDLERKSMFMDRNWDRSKRRLIMSFDSYFETTDKILFKDLLIKAVELPADQAIDPISQLVGKDDPQKSIDGLIDEAYSKTKLTDRDFVTEALEDPAKALKKLKDDPFLELAMGLYPLFQEEKEKGDARKGRLDKLSALLLDVKRQFKGETFLPDANGTLRLTYGYIRGYEPMDAVHYYPLTTVDGVLEKNTGVEPFDAPEKILDLIKKKDFGQYEHPKLKSVPTAILYNMDTTGGNSGSPIFDAEGKLVGVNFDRAFEATINDFAWSESYSRSIGVDIRYVLWVIEKLGGADWLLKEMGVMN
jgi:hypothetical protein